MTIATTSMSFLVREKTPHLVVESSSASISTPGDDADARRLAAAVARGDEAAFRQLYDRYQPRLFRLALVLGRGDESLAQDTVQSVFVTAAAKLRRVDGEEHLWNWLARVARQQLAKAWRQRQRDSAVVGMADLSGTRRMQSNPIPCWRRVSTRRCWRWTRRNGSWSNGFILTG